MSTVALSFLRQSMRRVRFIDLGIPAIILMIMAMLVVPMPAILLDILFTFNLLAGLVIITIAVATTRPLEFSSFPIILLLTTMLRLALNVASTRVVLVDGHKGADSAGKVIQAFGEFVIQGNYFVGIVIFAILMIINFIVVTKGAGRVSEVIARFTLDAMPGKQMAIDADLNAGVINQETAKKRREEISQEADFFGSMDGASKFVRGDAIAGVMILFINIFGGLIIGIGFHGLSLSEAGKIYTLLTIGDGLVAQIPALFLSLATAIIVTRVTTPQSLSEQTSSQLGKPMPLFVSASILLLIGIVPGMPHAVFVTLAGATYGIGFLLLKRDSEVTTRQTAQENAVIPPAPKELDWSDIDQVDLIGLEIGYGLIPMVNPETGGQLMARVKGIRKKLSAELGFLIPAVRVRDVLTLEPNSYNIMINGVVRATGLIQADRDLAINPGHAYGKLEGMPTKDPAFGLDAIWIKPSQKDYARTLGYTVVDSSTALATHLNRVLRENAADLISQDEAQQLLDKLAGRFPKLVENLVPGKLPLSIVTRVLQNLLAESVSIRDMRTIVETLCDESSKTQDPDQLTGLVRPRLGRMIVQNLAGVKDVLPVITLESNLERMLQNVAEQSGGGHMAVLEPDLAESLFRSLRNGTTKIQEQYECAVLVVSPIVRPWLAKMLKHRVGDLVVLSYSEIPDDQAIKVVLTIEIKSKQH